MVAVNRLTGSTAALAAAAAATASGPTDAAAQGRAPQASSWDGVFVGGSLGGSWLKSGPNGSSSQVVLAGYAPAFQPGGFEAVGDAKATNWLGGLQAGFNWQWGRHVVGVEGDFSWLGKKNATATGTMGFTYAGTTYAGTTFRESRVDALATFRGRYGYDFNGTMPYLTLGLALGHIKSTWSFAGTTGFGSSSGSISESSWQPGFVAGGGVEQKLAGNWSLRADVQWMKFKEQKLNNPVFSATYGTLTGRGGTSNFSNSLTVAKLGLNYRF